MNWKSVSDFRVTQIDKVVGEYDVWAHVFLPFPKFKVKIKENSRGGFTGQVNVALKSSADESPDWIVGFGNTPNEALEDAIKYFLNSVPENESLTEEDFEWADPHDF
ncbi:hypothetical protein POF51_07840 [Brevibacillus sp. AG]|uniref:hypothetical protein n=1 Tax=Brevibacillus sp. AG TaxID=3020891 RepID=UPI00232B98E6|nr:hypothetical protein [Brevibacillus sp. AG]MDC0760598.1 hypothetical protein [Brevibacillus sp. AG]